MELDKLSFFRAMLNNLSQIQNYFADQFIDTASVMTECVLSSEVLCLYFSSSVCLYEKIQLPRT